MSDLDELEVVQVRPRRRVRKGRLLIVVLFLGMVLGGCAAAFNAVLSAGELASDPVTVVVPEGVGAGDVAELLEDEGVIRSAFIFKLQARLDERSSQIRPGTYELQPGASFDTIITALTTVPEADPTFTVTIPEGLTVDETLRRIAQAEGSPFTVRQLRRGLGAVALPQWVPGDLPDGAQPFEGLLFPSTYDFLLDAEAPDIIGRLLEQTETVLERVGVDAGDRYEILTKASLVEREARIRDEQPIIASVMDNRIEQGMRLQVDATVVYAKYRQTGEIVNRVLSSDLEIDSPWNTYRVDGLPPTPISGSGESAIAAANEPAETDYLFYVVSDRETGEHAFAETLEEHNENVRRYREQRAAEEQES